MNYTWKSMALSAVRTFAKRHAGEKHVVEVIRWFAVRECGIQAPPNAKVWGGVIRLAAKLGVVSKSGFAPTVSSNGSPKVLWYMIPVTTTLPVVTGAGDRDEDCELLDMPPRKRRRKLSKRAAKQAMLELLLRRPVTDAEDGDEDWKLLDMPTRESNGRGLGADAEQ